MNDPSNTSDEDIRALLIKAGVQVESLPEAVAAVKQIAEAGTLGDEDAAAIVGTAMRQFSLRAPDAGTIGGLSPITGDAFYEDGGS